MTIQHALMLNGGVIVPVRWAYWKLDEASASSGTVLADASGHGRTCTLAGTASTARQPALAPDGAYSIKFLGNTRGLGPQAGEFGLAAISISAFFRVVSFNNAAIVSLSIISSPATTAFNLKMDGTNIYWVCRSRSQDADSQIFAPFSDTTSSHHVAATVNYNAKTMALYLDGALVSYTNSAGFFNSTLVISGTQTMRLAQNIIDSLTPQFIGWLDNVSIFSGELSAAEVAAIRAGG